MQIRAVLGVVAAAAMLLAPASASFAQGRGGQVRSGTVKSVDATGKTFVVVMRRMNQEADVTVRTNAETRFMKGTEMGAFTDLSAGKFVAFMGSGMPAQGIDAREVIVLDKPGSVVQGAVKSADAANKTIVLTVGRPGGAQMREVTVKTNDATKYMTGRQAGKWEDVTAGRRVVVIGEGNPREGVTATIIRVLPMGPGAGGASN